MNAADSTAGLPAVQKMGVAGPILVESQGPFGIDAGVLGRTVATSCGGWVYEVRNEGAFQINSPLRGRLGRRRGNPRLRNDAA